MVTPDTIGDIDRGLHLCGRIGRALRSGDRAALRTCAAAWAPAAGEHARLAGIADVDLLFDELAALCDLAAEGDKDARDLAVRLCGDLEVAFADAAD